MATKLQSAKTAYDQRFDSVSMLLTQLKVQLKNSKEQNPDWAHVGDMTEIDNQLRDIFNRLNNLGEYAEVGEELD